MEQNKVSFLDPKTGEPLSQQEIDEMFMRRCLQLAKNGRQNAKPNPMVGAVIVSSEGRIIGEGYHVRCGEGHAEVNAFASVRKEDEALLPEATIYVSLEPCAHYGKTPPCADLIVSKHVRRVVVGCVDPFAKVHGRGIAKIREAGIDVTVGVLEAECRALIRRFITVNTLQRPYIILKWAQSANHLIDNAFTPTALSTPFTQMLVHKLRSECDAIVVGRTTYNRDHPHLDVRHWAGHTPLPIVLSHSVPEGLPTHWRCYHSIDEMLSQLQAEHRQALLVEGGAHLLQQFINRGLYDEVRIETAPTTFATGTVAPTLPADLKLKKQELWEENIIETFVK